MSISTSLSKNWSFGWFTSLSLSAQTRFKLPPFLVDGVWADQLVNSRFVLLLQCWSVFTPSFLSVVLSMSSMMLFCCSNVPPLQTSMWFCKSFVCCMSFVSHSPLMLWSSFIKVAFKVQEPLHQKMFWVWDVSFRASFKNWFTLNVFLHYLIFCKFSMFLLGLTVYEHPLLKCLMLAQFGQQTRCCGFPFFKLKNDPDAVDPQSGRSQIPTLSPTLPKMEKGCKHFYHVSPCSLPHRCVLYVLPSQNKTDSFSPKI